MVIVRIVLLLFVFQVLASVVIMSSAAVISRLLGSSHVMRCPTCGADVTAKPQVALSRFAVRCSQNDGHDAGYLAVRPSALSLFGTTQHLLMLLAGACGLWLGLNLSFGRVGMALATLAALVGGWPVARTTIRMVAWGVVESGLPMSFRKEAMAHLAPPPWLVASEECAESANRPSGRTA